MLLSRGLLLFFLLINAVPAWSQWKPWNDLPPHCSHVIVLRGEEDRNLAEGIQWGEAVRLMHPGPRVLAATKEALGRMTPLMCRSVRRIAFGYYPQDRDKQGAVNSFGAGDLVLINLAHSRFYEDDLEKRSSQLMLQETIIHETAHAAETLFAVESKDGGASGYGGSWNMEARTLARKIIAKTRLESGLYNEWQRLHRSFRGEGWAQPYDTAAERKEAAGHSSKLPVRWRGASAKKIAEAGFMNTYGAVNWAEDLSTFVSNVYIGPEMAIGIKNSPGVSEDLRQDAACRVMQSYNEENVPATLSAAYAKLTLLADVEMIRKEDVDKCTGDSFGLLKVSGPGFHFFETGSLLRSFENKVEAGMGSKGAGNVFEMRAEGQASFGGKSFPANMKLSLGVGVGPLEKVSWPRGVYQLALVGPNSLELRLDGARAGNFNAREGFVLVTSSSSELIEGSIFLRQAWRPEAPIPVPQVFDPPLHIRFQLKK